MFDNEKWDRRYLALAELVSTWSKDPSTKIGAVIVDPVSGVVQGMGFNGFPRGVEDSDERYNEREVKYKLVAHAELNAILNAGRSRTSVVGSTIYVVPTLMIPNACPECCKSIVQSGIKTVVGWVGETTERWQEQAKYSSILLNEGGVTLRLIRK